MSPFYSPVKVIFYSTIRSWGGLEFWQKWSSENIFQHFYVVSWVIFGDRQEMLLVGHFCHFYVAFFDDLRDLQRIFLVSVFLTFLCCFLGWFTGPSRNILLHSSGEGRRFPDSNNEVGTFPSPLDFRHLKKAILLCQGDKNSQIDCSGISFGLEFDM